LDLVLAEELGRRELEDVHASSDLRTIDLAVVPVRRPEAAQDQVRRTDRTAVEVGDLHRVGRVGHVEHGHAALVPALDHDVATGHGHQVGLVGHTVLLVGLRRGQLVVVLEHQLWCRAAAVDGEPRVSTPGELLVRGGARGGAAAPLVGEHHRGAVVVEVRRVPVGEVLIGHRVDPDRVGRVGDVDEYAVALAGTGGQPDLREGRDVVAGVRVGGRGVPGPGRRA